MKIDVALQVLRRGQPLAARVTAQQKESRAWVGVYPLDLSRASTRAFLARRKVSSGHEGEVIFRVRIIEVPESLFDEDRWSCEEDLTSRVDVIVDGEEALL